jgi:O-antigen ligase
LLASSIENSRPESLPFGDLMLTLYLFSLFASHLILPPIFSHRFQPSEAIFLLASIYYYKLFLDRGAYIRFARKAWPILLYLGVVILTSLFQPSLYAVYKCLGTLYLSLVAFLFYHKGRFLLYDSRCWLNVTAILSLLLSIPIVLSITYLFLTGAEPIDLIESTVYYPIIGLYGRPEGFHLTPTMLIAVAIIPFWTYILTVHKKWNLSIWQHFAFGSVVILILSTFNKELFILLAFLPILFIRSYQFKRNVLFASMMIGLLFVQQILIHFIPMQPDVLDNATVYQGFTNCLESPSFELFGQAIYETHYTLIRIVEFSVLPDHWLFGIGLGNFPETFASFDPASGRYADCFNFEVEPHNTYLGLWIEMGILGLISSLLLFIYPLYRLYQKLNSKVGHRHLLLFLTLLTYAIMGLSTDVEDFRPLWVIIGLSFGLLYGHQA